MIEKSGSRPKIRVTYNAPVTLSFAILCTVIMILDQYVLNHTLTNALFIIPGNGASSHPFNFRAPLDYFRLFSHVFGHTDWSHLIGNMSLLLLLGPILENRYGSVKVALVMVITALVTGILNALFIAKPEMGASDIVFMMIMLSSFTSFARNEIPLSFILVFILYIGGQIYNAATLSAGGISVIAHIAGGLCGSLFAFLFAPVKSISDSTYEADDDDDIAGPSPRSAKKKDKTKPMTKSKRSRLSGKTEDVGTLRF